MVADERPETIGPYTILDVLGDVGDEGDAPTRPAIDYLTWADAADSFPGHSVEGTSRTSLIFRGDGFDKLILTERGPSYDADAIDLWQTEQDFLGAGDDFIFVEIGRAHV